MKQLTDLIKSRSLYFKAMLFVLAGSLGYLLLFNHSTSLSSNAGHPFWLNVFFINYTFIGDGLFAAALILTCFIYLKRKNEGFALLNAFIISGVLVQLIKNIAGTTGPKIFIEQGQYLFPVNGPAAENYNSFSSGHTAVAFAIATVLVLMIKNVKWQLPVLAAAMLVGYSRIYLAQHFLGEIMISALLGTLSGVAAVYMTYRFKGISWKLNLFKFHRNGEMSKRPMQTYMID